MDTLTRAKLATAAWREVGLTRAESERLVDATIEEMIAALVAGERVTIVNFGSFHSRARGWRMGRNPNTGEPVPLPARRVIAFHASRTLKAGVNEGVRESRRGR